jgi:hypothetical protein
MPLSVYGRLTDRYDALKLSLRSRNDDGGLENHPTGIGEAGVRMTLARAAGASKPWAKLTWTITMSLPRSARKDDRVGKVATLELKVFV